LRRLLNAVLTPLIRTGLVGRRFCLLTVTGRTTGRRYTTPVKIVADGERRWLVAPYGERNWVKNAKAAGWVELSRGRSHERLAVALVDAEEAGPVLRAYLRQNRVTRSFFSAAPGDPVQAFVAEAARHPVFRLGDVDGEPETRGLRRSQPSG
jgi:deazaflavin-dependent oxidoreductase (nitroreductase family)